MLAKFVVDSHFKSQAKGANLDDRAANNAQEDADMTPSQMDPEVSTQNILFLPSFFSYSQYDSI